jgi:hypothetical protein
MHDLGHGPFSHVFDNNLVPRLWYGIHYAGVLSVLTRLLQSRHLMVS